MCDRGCQSVLVPDDSVGKGLMFLEGHQGFLVVSFPFGFLTGSFPFPVDAGKSFRATGQHPFPPASLRTSIKLTGKVQGPGHHTHACQSPRGRAPAPRMMLFLVEATRWRWRAKAKGEAGSPRCERQRTPQSESSAGSCSGGRRCGFFIDFPIASANTD